MISVSVLLPLIKPTLNSLVFGCCVFSFYCGFHRWPWLIARLLAFITPTTAPSFTAEDIMEDQIVRDLGKLILLTENKESTVKAPDGMWSNNSLNADLFLVGRVLTRK